MKMKINEKKNYLISEIAGSNAISRNESRNNRFISRIRKDV